MLFWQIELIADLLKENPLQQIGVSPEEKLSQVDNLQIFFQAWKRTGNQVILFF